MRELTLLIATAPVTSAPVATKFGMSVLANRWGWESRGLVAVLWISGAFAGEPEAESETGSDLGRQVMAEWSTATPEHIEKSWEEETKTLTITQKLKSVVVNWIGTARTERKVRFRSEVPGATLLVRVTGGNPSVLNGFFWNDAEQKVVLVNPAGVVVGPNDTVAAGGLRVFSTLDISDGEVSLLDPEAPNGASVIGTTRSQNGDVILLGNFIEKLPAVVEFEDQGNVYALAIKENGTIRANENQTVEKGVLQIQQGSEKAIINWKNGLSFGEDEILELTQPSKESVAVFRYENHPGDFVPPRVKARGQVFFDNGDGTVTRIDEAGYGQVSKGEGILPQKR